MISTVITQRAIETQSCRMDVTRLEQRAYIKIVVLLERIARECHSELVEAVGNNALPYRHSLALLSRSTAMLT